MQVALYSQSRISPRVEIAAGAALLAFEKRSGKKARLPNFKQDGPTRAVLERRDKVKAHLEQGFSQLEISKMLGRSKVIICLDVTALKSEGLI